MISRILSVGTLRERAGVDVRLMVAQ